MKAKRRVFVVALFAVLSIIAVSAARAQEAVGELPAWDAPSPQYMGGMPGGAAQEPAPRFLAQGGPPPGGPPDGGPEFGGPDRMGGPERPGGPERSGRSERPGERPGPPMISEKEINETLERVKSEDPGMYADLVAIKDRVPPMFRELIADIHREGRDPELKMIKAEKPEMYNDILKMRGLNRKEKILVFKYRTAGADSEKKEIEKSLKSLLDDLFDLSLKQRQREIEELEKQMKRVKDEIQERRKRKVEIIQRHYEDITGKNDTLRW